MRKIRRQDSFYAKILLFGEYAILCNSMGLSVPYSHFSGELSFIGDDKYTDLNFAQTSNRVLMRYKDFLIEQKNRGELLLAFDISRFANEINNGLYFESSIPQGYGLGSSGALVAALYHRFVLQEERDYDSLSSREIGLLKRDLSLLESWFHGKSSGIDPLNCYLKQPLLIRNLHDILPVDLPQYGICTPKGAVFLLDTGGSGRTQPLVKQFLELCDDSTYYNKIQSEFIPLNNQCINALLENNMGLFFSTLKKLTHFTLLYFRSMIPEAFVDVWKKGLKTDDFYLKLCGSGGGGSCWDLLKIFKKRSAAL